MIFSHMVREVMLQIALYTSFINFSLLRLQELNMVLDNFFFLYLNIVLFAL